MVHNPQINFLSTWQLKHVATYEKTTVGLEKVIGVKQRYLRCAKLKRGYEKRQSLKKFECVVLIVEIGDSD